ncbi:MAG: hypothetical protein CMD08_04310 [Flavobacteriales bacterium]|nr:hypothetical protein [Flavobacteriales bacterium]
MKLFIQIALGIFVFCTLSCGSMRDVGIYEPTKTISSYEKFPYKTLFISSEEDGLWGIKSNSCKQVSFKNTNSYIGSNHLHIKWDASKCNYIAVGLKWGNYKGKNLKPIIESTAIELRVRIDSGELSNIPMFFILVDYAGNQCRANINYLNLEDGKIDTEWKRIRIPLQAFNYEKRGVNMNNIKELRLEFQRKGDLHIDNIILVPHEHNYKLTKNKFKKVFDSHPIQLGVGKEYWWGINTKYSSSLKFGGSFDNESVIVDLDVSKETPWNTFGFSPYKWMRVDLSSIYSTSALKFKIRSTEIPSVQVFLFAYTGKKRRLQKILNESHFIDKKNGIYEAYIPLKSLIGYREFRWDEIKEIRIKILENTKFEIGEFQLIEFRGNPKKPTKWKGI